ncbi:MAG: PorV/PorQ family protein [Candidatus Zixiibacteriota bacterium]
MKTVISLLIVLALAVPVMAGGNNGGSVGAQFLKIGVGSRYLGMADVGVVTAHDAYAAYWNPAGLVEVENWSLAFTNVNWLVDIDLNYFAAARQYEDVGVFGASVAVLSAGEQEITTVADQDGTGSTYRISSYAIGLSFARQLTHRFAFGMSAKYVGEEIGEVDSRGFGVDFGTMLYTGFNSLRVGMAITNMGPDLRFSGAALKVDYDGQSGNDSDAPVDAELSTRPYNLPLTFRVGMAYDFDFGPRSVLTLAAELNDPSDGRQRGAFGAELGYMERFFLRGGYKLRYEEQGLAVGGGVVAPLGENTRMTIDYAWQDFGRLESTQRFSVGFTF